MGGPESTAEEHELSQYVANGASSLDFQRPLSKSCKYNFYEGACRRIAVFGLDCSPKGSFNEL